MNQRLHLLLTAVTVSVTIAAHAQSNRRPVLHGHHVPPGVAQLQSAGRLASARALDLTIGLPLRNQAALDSLLRELYDPASPNYRHFLTPEQFTERFGPTIEDYQAVVAYARANGFTVTATDPGRVLVSVSAPVAVIEKVLHVNLRLYNHPKEARNFFAPDAEPSLDLTVPIQDVGGLDDYVLPHPAGLHIMPLSDSGATPQSGSAPGGGYAGVDFRAAYAPGVTFNGAGQSVGLIQFGGYYSNDITHYEDTYEAGLRVPIVNVLLDGVTSITNNPGVEEALDIEMEISMAPGMDSLYYYRGTSIDTMLSRIASDNTVNQVSASWLYGTSGSTDGLWQQLAAQGITFFNASGDYDAYPIGTSINACCSTPYVTCVGGTTLSTTGAGGSWSSESVWNWGGGTGSSGGISTSYSIPSWQTGIDMTACHGSTTMRNIPDVALTGDNVYVWYNGSGTYVGGTSCASPLWAGFMALVNQQAAYYGLPPVGALNPAVYAIGKGTNYAAAFHDTTSGNNYKTASPTNFPAVAGYDLCTGWGTPKGKGTLDALSPPNFQVAPLAGFAAYGPPGGPFYVNSQNFILTNLSAQLPLSWSLPSAPNWLTISPTSGSLNTNGSANVTISLNSSVANSLAPGTYSATILFTNLTQASAQTRTFSLVIGSGYTVWTGGGGPNGNWSLATNWLGNGVPNATGANLVFTGNAQPINTNDSITSVGWVLLNPATAFTIGGSTLSITNGMTNAAQNNLWNTPLSLGPKPGFDVASGTTLTLGGVVSGANALTKTSAGTLILSAANTYTGPTTISGGILTLGGAGTLGGGAYAGNITNNAAFVYNSTVAQTLTGVISGTGTLTQQGGGNLTLAGANTYSGATTLNSGSTLVIGSSGSLGSGKNYAGIISGGGGLTYSGSGTQTLSGVNTYSGPTLVNSGILVLANSGGSAGTIGGSAIIVTNGAELDLNNQDVLGYASSSPLTIYGTVKKTYNQAETLNRPITLSGGTFTNTLTTAQAAYELFGNYIATAANTTNFITGPGQFGLRTSTTYFTNAPGSVLDISAVIYPYTAGCPLNKQGPGTMILRASNTYSGNTVVGGGTLALTGSASIASSPAILMDPSALLDVSGLTSTFTLGAGKSLTAGNPGVPLTNINGNFSSAGSINVAGTLTINGNLSLAGGTLFYDFGSVPDLIALSGAGPTLSLSGTTTLQPSAALGNGTYTLITNISSIAAGTAANLAFTGGVVRGGTAAFTVAAPAVTLTVSGGAAANLVWQGTNGPNWDLSTTNWLNTGTGLTDKFYALDNISFDDSGSGTNVVLTGSLYPASVPVSTTNNNYSFGGSGAIAGAASLLKSGPSTLTISNANSFTGGTTLSAGTLKAANPNALGLGPLTMTGGTLDLNSNSVNISSLSGAAGTITDNYTSGGAAVTSTLTVNQVASNSFAGLINKGASNNIALVKNGTNYLLLTGASTYGGGTIVNAGTLEVTGNSGAKIYTVAPGATLKIGYSVGAGNYGYGITVNGNGVSDPSGFYLKGGQSVSLQSALTLQTAPSTVRAYGSGTATLSGFDINYNHLSVAAAASGSVLAPNVSLSCASYGYRMDVAPGANTAMGDLAINGVISGSGSVTWNGVTVNLEKYGAGSVLLTNVSTSTGYGIGAGTIILAGGNNRLPSTAWVVLGNGGSGVLQLNGVSQTLAGVVAGGTGAASAVVGGSATLATLTINNSAAVTNGSSIGGSGVNQNNLALVKSGAGLLLLSGPGTYTGATTVNAGTLQVDGSLGTNTVTVANTATLAGTGTVNGPTTIQSGGILAPGDAGIGALTFNTSLTLNAGAKSMLEMNKNGGVINNDLVSVTGALALGGTLTVTNVSGNALVAGDSVDLFNAGSFSGSFSAKTLPALATNLVWDTSQLASNGVITVAALPAITSQPHSIVTNAGNTVAFSVGATGTATLAYQWRLNGTNLAAGTLATLTLNNVQLTNAGNYTVVVTNNYGGVTSTVATLTVNVPATISTPPQSATVYVSSNVAFSVTASGTPVPACQWRFNGTNLANATASSYTVTNSQPANEGAYTVVVTNVAGVQTSAVATLSLYREFGSAPAPYPRLLSSNGARHLIVPGFQLGATNIASTDALTNNVGNDGVSFLTGLRPGQGASIQVVASGAGYLSGWIDFGGSGSWTDPLDQVATNLVLIAGTNTVSFTVPRTAVVTAGTWARFRFSTATNLTFTGEAPDGEVEDYQVAILANPPATVSLDSPSDGASYMAPATISLAASVTTNGNTINKVQFYESGTNLLAEVAAEPFVYAWNGVGVGSYSLLARVVYNDASTSDSAIAEVAVTNSPPSIVLNSPANDASYTAPATISLSASVTTNGNAINKVQFIESGTNLLVELAAEPFAYAWTNVAAGNYNLSARLFYNGSGSVDSTVAGVSVTNAVVTPPQNPVISQVAIDSEHSFVLTCTGTVGQTYYLLAGQDLKAAASWPVIDTNSPGTNGLFQFLDLNATNYSLRYYRLQAQ